jgi:hypothetical protein
MKDFAWFCSLRQPKYFVAVVTGRCVKNDRPEDPEDENA